MLVLAEFPASFIEVTQYRCMSCTVLPSFKVCVSATRHGDLQDAVQCTSVRWTNEYSCDQFVGTSTDFHASNEYRRAMVLYWHLD